MKVFSILLLMSSVSFALGFNPGNHKVKGVFKMKDSKRYVVVYEDTNSEEWLEITDLPKGFSFSHHRGLEYILKIEVAKKCSFNCHIKLLEVLESVPF